MDIAPIDVRQQQFRTTFRGYDKAEVAAFMLMVADHYEQALRETERMRQEVARLEAIVNEQRDHERSLKTTLLAAQQLAESIKTNAEQEGQRLLREAQSRSSLLLENAQARLDDIQRGINTMKLKRRDVETTIEASIQVLRNALDYVQEQDTQDREDKILLHRARPAEAAPPQPARHDAQAVGQ